MKLPALIAAPLAWIYGLIINVRHKLFDLKILRSEEFDIPVVCVGNLTVGGTGKTPVTEFLIERLSGERRVAVLSRGYRRRTKGFVLSTPRSSVKSIGDEPKQMKMKYPDVPMAVCEKRAEGIRRLRAGEVIKSAGFDGEYGTIKLFQPYELEEVDRQR